MIRLFVRTKELFVWFDHDTSRMKKSTGCSRYSCKNYPPEITSNLAIDLVIYGPMTPEEDEHFKNL